MYDTNNPDWAPTVGMTYETAAGLMSYSAFDRYSRLVKRRKWQYEQCTDLSSDKENQNPAAANVSRDRDPAAFAENTCPASPVSYACRPSTSNCLSPSLPLSRQENSKQISTMTATDLTFQDLTKLERNQSQATKDTPLTKEWLEEDNERVRFYTGLPSMTVLMAVFSLVSPGLPVREVLTKFQQLLLSLMRLRLNLTVQDLSYRFQVHFSTVSRVFKECIQVMFTSMSFLIRWPSRDELRLTLPECFRNKQFSSCAVILDCFEVFIERPSCLLARAQTWSSYKHHNTAKFLIGITPQGTVSFISYGWGGRVSDKCVTENCGILEKLLPGDLVLADRGFDIHDSCGLYAARLKIPSFTKGKPQLSPLEIETTRALANVRIHVERVIGCVRQKYTILGHGIIPVQLLMSENGEPCLVDKIAVVCCSLTNCCKSVISSE